MAAACRGADAAVLREIQLLGLRRHLDRTCRPADRCPPACTGMERFEGRLRARFGNAEKPVLHRRHRGARRGDGDRPARADGLRYPRRAGFASILPSTSSPRAMRCCSSLASSSGARIASPSPGSSARPDPCCSPGTCCRLPFPSCCRSGWRASSGSSDRPTIPCARVPTWRARSPSTSGPSSTASFHCLPSAGHVWRCSPSRPFS